MGLWDFVKTELIDIIQWLDDTGDTMVHRFDGHDNEIKNGAQLIVRPGQAAVFVNQGQVADVFGPGRHELRTENLPILSTILGWKYGFNSPFKAEVFFVATKQFTDQKWGTKAPIMLRDPEFGPVRLRAFGTYVVRVVEPAKFIAQIVGTNGVFTTGDIGEQLRSLVTSRFIDALGEAKIPMLDLASRYDEIGGLIREKMVPDFAAWGLELTQFLIESIALPEEVEKALDRRSSMGVIGDLGAYTQFQTAESIPLAAQNPGGTAGAGMGMGMGFAMAQQMANAMGQGGAQPQAAGGPPPLPQQGAYFVAVNGQQSGPHGLDALRQQAGSGALTRETLVWKQGMAAWSPAGQVDELSQLFGAVPPPLPPQ
ncbi:SPFH domain-containing protein [Longimicrobium sp.]|uniref:SPFH domain-containing protein n=1 Tax=Longimicrobium sp. TaxID=2029185 RepID=UPI002BA84547|nr:SPFH domain-containing protein [Longimicrobium sp.]HSU14473.1 SPFH domain-containing protein [Longimicrobium sp.]